MFRPPPPPPSPLLIAIRPRVCVRITGCRGSVLGPRLRDNISHRDTVRQCGPLFDHGAQRQTRLSDLRHHSHTIKSTLPPSTVSWVGHLLARLLTDTFHPILMCYSDLWTTIPGERREKCKQTRRAGIGFGAGREWPSTSFRSLGFNKANILLN